MQQRRSYQTPQCRRLGTVQELTHNGSSNNADVPGGNDNTANLPGS